VNRAILYAGAASIRFRTMYRAISFNRLSFGHGESGHFDRRKLLIAPVDGVAYLVYLFLDILKACIDHHAFDLRTRVHDSAG